MRDVIPRPDSRSDAMGTVVRVYTSADGALDGRVDVDLGGGQVASELRVMATWTPSLGALVAMIRYPDGQRIVLGPVRSTNPTPSVSATLAIPYLVTPGTPAVANPYVVAAASGSSYQSTSGWTAGAVKQGTYSTAYAYWDGLWFYGASAFDALAGRTAGASTLRVRKNPDVGSAGAVSVWAALHAHATQPSGAPLWLSDAVLLGTLSNASPVADLPIPPSFAQALIDKRAAGIGLLRRSTVDYLASYGPGTDNCGRLSLGWA